MLIRIYQQFWNPLVRITINECDRITEVSFSRIFLLFSQGNSLIELYVCMFLNILGDPVEVGVTMYVLSISSLSEVQMVSTSKNVLLYFVGEAYRWAPERDP